MTEFPFAPRSCAVTVLIAIFRSPARASKNRVALWILSPLMVMAASAALPARADVLSFEFVAVREGSQESGQLGRSVSTAGDVNGDGYSDLLLGGHEAGGTVWCYHGNASGIDAAPSWSVAGQAEWGTSLVAPAGDVNGDGYGDVLVGAPVSGELDQTAVFVYLGSASGLAATPQVVLEGNDPDDVFGASIDAAGDVDGDGYDDIIVGAPYLANGQTDEGSAYVFRGSASGIQATPAWSFEGNALGVHFGWRVAGAGDVNGDGFADIVVSAPDFVNPHLQEGKIYVFHGSASGLASVPAFTLESNIASGRMGVGLGTAGDMNADGYSDIVVDVGTGSPSASAIQVHYGSSSGITAAISRQFSSVGEASLGDVVYTAGDINGDGCADLITSIPTANQSSGKILIFCGVETANVTLSPFATRFGEEAGEYFGLDARPAGDVNGDGFGDVVVGAPYYDTAQTDAGAVRLFFGQPSLPPGSSSWTQDQAQSNSHQSWSLAQGDWNGDGFTDIAVGIPHFDSNGFERGAVTVYYGGESGYSTNWYWFDYGVSAPGHFGHSVGNAGDTNGDGYDDLIVGEPYANSGKGAAYVYKGSATGLSASPLWTFNGDVYGHFGWSVAGAGDVNADGYADVIVGMPDLEISFPTIRGGRTYLHRGSPTGPSQSAALAISGVATADQCGYSVAGAGDVNGDGFDDIIVGFPGRESGQTDEGFARVYFGAPSAFSGIWTLEGNQVEARYGTVVSPAGDLNADGFADIVISTPFYDQAGADRGIAIAFLGSAGNTMTEAWFTTGAGLSEGFGMSLSGGGDVNNDGYSDIMVGAPFSDSFAPDGGTAQLCLGDASGGDGATAWQTWGTTTGGAYGYAVSCAGDATGDGFGDLFVGQPYFDSGKGRAHGFYGGLASFAITDDSGVLMRPRQFRSDGTTPIALGGVSDDQHGFELSALGRSAKGRSLIQAEYQVARAGSGWSSAVFDGPTYDTGAPVSGTGSAALAQVSVTSIPASATYHWRVRFRAESPYFPHTAWLSMPGNGATDLRTAPGATGVAQVDAPTSSALAPLVGPNPCRSEATIWFSMPASGRARLDVYDVSGRRVARLIDRNLDTGPQTLTWNTRDESGHAVAAGLYLLRLERGSAKTATKLVVRR